MSRLLSLKPLPSPAVAPREGLSPSGPSLFLFLAKGLLPIAALFVAVTGWAMVLE